MFRKVNPSCPLPVSSITGALTKPGWVEPLIEVNGDLISGSSFEALMFQTPWLCPESDVGIANTMLTPLLAFASSIAARSVHSGAPAAFCFPVLQLPSPGDLSPLLSVELTVKVDMALAGRALKTTRLLSSKNDSTRTRRVRPKILLQNVITLYRYEEVVVWRRNIDVELGLMAYAASASTFA